MVNKSKGRILRLRNVFSGKTCRHTGDTIMHGQRQPTPFIQDKGLLFVKTSDSAQTLPDGKEVIFAPNDLVKVVNDA